MKQKVIFICGLWALFALFNFAAPDRVFSETENRYLAQRPKIDGKRIRSGGYMTDFEDWMTDQVSFRDAFVSLKASADRLAGRSDSGGVYLGRDGWLLEMFTEADEQRLKRNTETAAALLRDMEDQGMEAHFLMVPTAACVMQEKLPAFAPELDQRELFGELAKKLPGFVDVTDTLIQAKDEAEKTGDTLYYRTDHHWTSLGAYFAYTELCRVQGREIPPISHYQTEVISTEFYGTGYSKAGLYFLQPDRMTAMYPEDNPPVLVDYRAGEQEDTLYDRSFLEKRDKYRVFLKGNYPLIRITTREKNGRRLLLVKDSYANTFVQFLTEDYEEILVVDPRYFRDDLAGFAGEQGVTDVLFLYQIKKFAEDTGLAAGRK